MGDAPEAATSGKPGREPDAEASRAMLAALDGLRRDIREHFPTDRGAPPEARAIDLEALWNGARRRLGSLGMREHIEDIDEFGMDDEALRRLRPLLDFLADRYWRIDLAGLEHLPAGRPSLLVANRAGLLPYDGLMLAHAIQRRRPGSPRPRFLVADWLMPQPFVHATVARLGGVRECSENASRLLATNRSVITFPEGAAGAAKSYQDRYRLQDFAPDAAIALARESEAPLIPVGIVGAEEVQPVMWKFEGPARRLGLPFLPVTPTFPLLGLLGLAPLPSKWVIRIGPPIALEARAVEAGDERAANDIDRVRAAVDRQVQTALRGRDSVWR